MHTRTERQVWPRHKPDCPKGKLTLPRTRTGCKCPIYARVTILDPDTGDVLFRWRDSSLHKLGIRTVEKGDELVDSWFKKYLSGTHEPLAAQVKLLHPVTETNSFFLDALLPTVTASLKPHHGIEPMGHPTYKKYKTILSRLANYAKIKENNSRHPDHPLLKDFDTKKVLAFQESWLGRRVKDPKTGKFSVLPKSKIAKDRDQGLLRVYFEWCRKNGYILIDPCDNLGHVTPGKSPVKPFTFQERDAFYAAIPVVYPMQPKQQMVTAFAQLDEHAGCRISAVATAETAKLEDTGIWLRERKEEKDGLPDYVWCRLPPHVVAMLRALTPKTKHYFFWTGKSTLKTQVTHWTEILKPVYVKAGITDKRSHEWRDFMGAELQRIGADLEHIQVALNHDKKTTTERSYVSKNKRRFAELDGYKEQLWGLEPTAPSKNAMDALAQQLDRFGVQLKAGLLTPEEFTILKQRAFAPLMQPS